MLVTEQLAPLRRPFARRLVGLLLCVAGLAGLAVGPEACGGQVMTTLDQPFSGSLHRRLPGGRLRVEADTKRHVEIFTKVTLEAQTRYTFRVVAERSPHFAVDLYAPGYDDEEQELLVIVPGRPRAISASFDSGAAPRVAYLRVHFGAGRWPVTLHALQLVRWSRGSHLARWLSSAALVLGLLLALGGGGDRQLAALLFLVALLAYGQLGRTGRNTQFGDNYWYMPTAFSLIAEGSTSLDHVAGIRPAAGDGDARLTPRGWVNYFPLGTSLLALPAAALSQLWELDVLAAAALAASSIAALAVALLFVLLRRLGQPRWLALTLALVFAFCTSQLSTHANALWSHNGSVMLSLALLCCLLGGERQLLLAAPLSALGYLTRPDFALLALAALAFVALRRRTLLVAYVGLGALSVLPFVLWSLAHYGGPLPEYYRAGRLVTEGYGEALLGQLFSASRGLFVFNPLLAFGVVGGLLVWRQQRASARVEGDRGWLLRLVAAVVLLHVVLVAAFPHWWGGHCYGPRLHMPVVPLLLLLSLPVIELVRRGSGWSRLRWVALALALLCAGWGAFVHVRGAWVIDTQVWNGAPKNIDDHPQRLWDWRDMQIFAKR